MKIAHPPRSITVAAGQVGYLEVQQASELITAVQVWWTDDVSSATLALETTNRPALPPWDSTIDCAVATDSTGPGEWHAESDSLTGPNGTGAGGDLAHVTDCGAARMRLKVTAVADTTLYVLTHGKA